MIRSSLAALAIFTLAGCAALDADTIANGHQNASVRDLRFNDSDCNMVIDSRTITIRSSSGTAVRAGDGFCEETRQVVNNQTTTRTTALATISGDVAFDVNSARIKQSFFSTLDGLANQMRSRSGSRFSIIGHTDSTGPEEFNQQLSERRAKSVADYLVNKGVERTALSILGVGESRPVGDNSTANGRRQNRRVEVYEVSGGGTISTTRTTTSTISGGNVGQGSLIGPSGIIRQ